jgi:hypothetical protein
VSILRSVLATVVLMLTAATALRGATQVTQESLADGVKQQAGTPRNPALAETCPVTKLPSQPFVPPSPYPVELGAGQFWFGTKKVWTNLPIEGTWKGLRQKIFWWHEGYDWRGENPPQLTVTGRRLDGKVPLLEPVHANAGWTNDVNHPFMVVAFDVPTFGCWEITGDYKGDRLTFVVWVGSILASRPSASQPSDCSAQDLLGVLKADDPVYDDALELANTLDAHGIPVKCVLQSKMIREFEGQKGAALYRTNRGDFEALFLPKERVFAVRPSERREDGRYLYYFEGAPSPSSPHALNSSRRTYFAQHSNQFFITWEPQLAASLDKTLNSHSGPGG